VRVIGPEGDQLGILDTREAIRQAESHGLDLVQVADKADPPVCKIMDYGKYKYQEKKKNQAAKKKQVVVEVKEIQLRPKTETHDINHKAQRAVEFLEEGDKVKVTVFYRGRELEHVGVGWQTLMEFARLLDGKAIIDSQPSLEGKRLMVIFGPGKKGKPEAPLASTMVRPRNIPEETFRLPVDPNAANNPSPL
jgi:translation initiation factor IF-3